MYKLLPALFFIFLLYGCSPSKSIQPIEEMTERLLPENYSSFIFEEVPSDSDFFELEQRGEKIAIKGNNGVSMARGLNYFLRNYCHKSVSWCGNNMSGIPEVLPSLDQKVRVSASFPYRYYLNYCTYSYSMAYWDWARWEKEIDWMALQGINMP